MSKRKSDSEENNVASDDSAELIKQELAKPPAYAKLHLSSSITKKYDDTYEFTPHVTPSSTIAPSMSDVAKSNKHYFVDESYFSDEDASCYKPRRAKKRRSRIHTSTPTKSTSSNFIKQQSGDINKLQLFEIEKKKSGDATTLKNKVTKLLSSGISVYGNNDVTTNSPYRLLDPSTDPMVSEKVCMYCHSKGYMCHEKRYSRYCYQATYAYLQDKDHGLFAGFSPARMESVYMTAYNEIRRSDMWMRFGYYTPGWLRIPKCMELNSMKSAVDLGYDPALCTNLEKENEDGRSFYFGAKRDNNS